MTDESAAVVERYDYDAYGEPRVYAGVSGSAESGALRMASAIGNPYMHQGLRWDGETGLHENRYRVLHSRLGRFMQRDPVGYEDSLSLFEYEASAPGTLLDPTGEFIQAIACAGCAAVMATIVADAAIHCSSVSGGVGEFANCMYEYMKGAASNPVVLGEAWATCCWCKWLGGKSLLKGAIIGSLKKYFREMAEKMIEYAPRMMANIRKNIDALGKQAAKLQDSLKHCDGAAAKAIEEQIEELTAVLNLKHRAYDFWELELKKAQEILSGSFGVLGFVDSIISIMCPL